MASKISHRARHVEKQESRARDQLDMREGRASGHDVQRRNDMFAGFDPARASIRVKIAKA